MVDPASDQEVALHTLVRWRTQAQQLRDAAAELDRVHVPLLVQQMRRQGVPREAIAAAAGVTVKRVDQLIASGKAAESNPPAWYCTNAATAWDPLTCLLGVDP